MVKYGFGQQNLEVYTDSDLLFNMLKQLNWKDKNLLLMSSGTFSGKDLTSLARDLI
jgi:UDP-N-acetylmuramate: L-alanyl-gamma-D-glutamyl-meso-diaminopimelate ligase